MSVGYLAIPMIVALLCALLFGQSILHGFAIYVGVGIVLTMGTATLLSYNMPRSQKNHQADKAHKAF
ncbi:MAG: hypothetical protein V4668_03535 [Patescibacteria group bacterium]